jgi:hypothetical protein
MQITTAQINRYRRSLKDYMGYRAEDNWSTQFDTHLVNVLDNLLNQPGPMQDFLSRYPLKERDRREPEVRYVVTHWLADFSVSA